MRWGGRNGAAEEIIFKDQRGFLRWNKLRCDYRRILIIFEYFANF